MSACFSGLFIAIKQQHASWALANALIGKGSYDLTFHVYFYFRIKLLECTLIKFLGTESIALQLFSHNTEINKSNRVAYAFPSSV